MVNSYVDKKLISIDPVENTYKKMMHYLLFSPNPLPTKRIKWSDFHEANIGKHDTSGRVVKKLHNYLFKLNNIQQTVFGLKNQKKKGRTTSIEGIFLQEYDKIINKEFDQGRIEIFEAIIRQTNRYREDGYLINDLKFIARLYDEYSS